jgi:RimJ/RimL family protein N-acetyltransferase
MTACPVTRTPGPEVATGHRPWARPVVLRDGQPVLIRQVQPTDAALLADGFARLSVRSRRSRFLIAKNHLSPSELRYFTDVDHHDHEALGAVSLADGSGVGVARYIRHPHDPQAAEIAVTVVDSWQGRGLGTQLVAQLTERARQEGIHRFSALVSADNAAVLALLRNRDLGTCVAEPDGDIVELEITLAAPRCALCGRPAGPTESVAGPHQRRWICDACIRANVPRVEAELDHLWWQ